MQELIRVFGIVQGVGFRPFIANLAREFNLRGTVSNRGAFVEIFCDGEGDRLDEFRRAIVQKKPPRSIILQVEFEPVKFDPPNNFEIIESNFETGVRFVSPDIAICPDCQREMLDPNDRRYLHPFINCTACGARLTIIEKLPYDRERTTMKIFPMCESCREEYENPNSRRYDAQPICCNDCGASYFLLSDPKIKNLEAIHRACDIVKSGGIVAVKGIGGFHLCCDARNPSAIQKLRDRKHRPSKPFAVMFRNLEAVRSNCFINIVSEKILDGYQKPILLLPKKKSSTLPESIAPMNSKIGAFLPYAPIHLLIFRELQTDSLIMTSGNFSGSPICRNDSEAQEFLSGIADEILTNDREILLRADDSVAEIFRDEIYMIRRSRGFAPLPFHVKISKSKKILALGADLKNSFCFSDGEFVFNSPYIGDLSDLRSIETLRESVNRMLDLFEIQPDLVACDLHPLYQSSKIATELKLPIKKIQHHHSHVASCLAENNFHGDSIGIAFDGTGFGLDGSIWGGEIFVNFERRFSINSFIHAGGDQASRDGSRIANSMLIDLFPDPQKVSEIFGINSTFNATKFLRDRNLNCIKSTSCGRLFDAVSAILGVKSVSTFEGEAAVDLQNCAMKSNDSIDRPKFSIDQTRDLFRFLVEKRIEGVSTDLLALEFHRVLAEMILDACLKIRQESKIETVAISGGCFQNTLLLDLTMNLLEKNSFQVLIHHLNPPNDGGIALGQIYLVSKHEV